MAVVLAFFAGIAFGAILQFLKIDLHKNAIHVASFGTPLVIGLFAVASYLAMAVVGGRMHDYEREWRSRIGGWMLRIAFCWAGFFFLTLHLPAYFSKIAGYILANGKDEIKATAVLSWVLTTAASLWAAKRQRVKKDNPGWQRVLAAIGPPDFLAGILTLLAVAVTYALGGFERLSTDPESYLKHAIPKEIHIELVVLGSCILIAVLIGGFAPVNKFSLHSTYASRLIRCYLGASRRKFQWRCRFGEQVAAVRPPERPVCAGSKTSSPASILATTCRSRNCRLKQPIHVAAIQALIRSSTVHSISSPARNWRSKIEKLNHLSSHPIMRVPIRQVTAALLRVRTRRTKNANSLLAVP
jgi:hypothetical protein